MLRKKLSKLIVAVMATLIISGGMGLGQAAFASSNTEVVASQDRTVVDVNASTTEEEVINAIKTDTVSTLRVTRELVLTSGIVDAINSRTAPLTIEVGEGGTLIIEDAINLDGKNSLKLVRVGNKRGAILKTKDKDTNSDTVVQVTIKGVTFDNKSIIVNAPYFINDQKFSVTLEGNNVVSGTLAYDRRPTGGQTSPVTSFKNNNLGNGSITPLYTLDAEINYPILNGSTSVTVAGKVLGNLATEVTGTANIIITDANGNIVKTSKDLSITDTVNSVEELFEGLTPGVNYRAFVEINVKDKDDNSYTRKSVSVQFTTINFSSTVTNITSSSATINISNGDTSTISYPLTLEVLNGSTSVFNDKIEEEENVTSFNITGLSSGTSYTYVIKDKDGNVINTGTFKTSSSTISGNAGSSSVTTIGDLTTNDINKADITDVNASIPVGNTTLDNSLRNGKDYKINIEGVTVTYSNGKVELNGLVPEKEYKDLTITYTDKDGHTRTIKVPTFSTKVSTTRLRQFIKDVYKYSLDRVADERGFAYWEDQLKNKETSPEDFVKNLLNEKEFIDKHATTESKIEGLYQVIVNRSSDSQGLSYWTNKYNDLLKKGYSESMALVIIVDEMVNEQEFKNRVIDLGL